MKGAWMGTLRCRVGCADPAQCMNRLLRANIPFQRPDIADELTLEITVAYGNYGALKKLCQRQGYELTVLRRAGLLEKLAFLKRRKTLAVCMALVLLLALYLPNKVLFVVVEGDSVVPEGQLLLAAGEAGLHFWMDRSEVDSYVIQNNILQAIPELSWVGVNTKGFVAYVSVTERILENETEDHSPVTNVVAARDGVITEVHPIGGQSVCTVGQAVREGEILISGIVECPTHIWATHADGEVYALTGHEETLYLPAQGQQQGEAGETSGQVSVILGKNRIKIFGTSSNFDATCDKIITYVPLALPGGFYLPVSLCVEQEISRAIEPVSVDRETVTAYGEQYLWDLVYGDMIAGEIRSESFLWNTEDSWHILKASFSCQEMISRQVGAEIFEGD